MLGNEKQYIPVTSVNLHNRFRRGDPDYDLAFLVLAQPLKFSHDLIHLCLPTKDFCEKVLMHSGTKGITKRQRTSQTQGLVYMALDQCRGQLNVSHRLSNKMFCMRGNRAAKRPDSYYKFSKMEAANSSKLLNAATKVRQCSHLLPGTPVATVHRGTAYLTGLMKSASTDCDGGLVFTKISRYLSWIKMWMKELNNDMHPQIGPIPSL